MAARAFSDLRIWQEAHRLTLEIYRFSSELPTEERFGLTAQMRRAAGSVAANIAEGSGRNSCKEFMQFLFIARGSTKEMINHCILARDLGYFTATRTETLLRDYNGLAAGIYACIQRLKQKTQKKG